MYRKLEAGRAGQGLAGPSRAGQGSVHRNSAIGLQWFDCIDWIQMFALN